MLVAIATLCCIPLGQNAPMPTVVPQPMSMVASSHGFTLNDKTVIVASGSTGRMLQSFLSPATGYALDVKGRGVNNAVHMKEKNAIHLRKVQNWGL
ncbi:MAG: hypothetical protein H7Y17_15005, partial [Chlorobia bacterium]|nr:hypothetical protein [Fimbriimonadaceae bacterium]